MGPVLLRPKHDKREPSPSRTLSVFSPSTSPSPVSIPIQSNNTNCRSDGKRVSISTNLNSVRKAHSTGVKPSPTNDSTYVKSNHAQTMIKRNAVYGSPTAVTESWIKIIHALITWEGMLPPIRCRSPVIIQHCRSPIIIHSSLMSRAPSRKYNVLQFSVQIRNDTQSCAGPFTSVGYPYIPLLFNNETGYSCVELSLRPGSSQSRICMTLLNSRRNLRSGTLQTQVVLSNARIDLLSKPRDTKVRSDLRSDLLSQPRSVKVRSDLLSQPRSEKVRSDIKSVKARSGNHLGEREVTDHNNFVHHYKRGVQDVVIATTTVHIMSSLIILTIRFRNNSMHPTSILQNDDHTHPKLLMADNDHTKPSPLLPKDGLSNNNKSDMNGIQIFGLPVRIENNNNGQIAVVDKRNNNYKLVKFGSEYNLTTVTNDNKELNNIHPSSKSSLLYLGFSPTDQYMDIITSKWMSNDNYARQWPAKGGMYSMKSNINYVAKFKMNDRMRSNIQAQRLIWFWSKGLICSRWVVPSNNNEDQNWNHGNGRTFLIHYKYIPIFLICLVHHHLWQLRERLFIFHGSYHRFQFASSHIRNIISFDTTNHRKLTCPYVSKYHLRVTGYIQYDKWELGLPYNSSVGAKHNNNVTSQNENMVNVTSYTNETKMFPNDGSYSIMGFNENYNCLQWLNCYESYNNNINNNTSKTMNTHNADGSKNIPYDSNEFDHDDSVEDWNVRRTLVWPRLVWPVWHITTLVNKIPTINIGAVVVLIWYKYNGFRIRMAIGDVMSGSTKVDDFLPFYGDISTHDTYEYMNKDNIHLSNGILDLWSSASHNSCYDICYTFIDNISSNVDITPYKLEQQYNTIGLWCMKYTSFLSSQDHGGKSTDHPPFYRYGSPRTIMILCMMGENILKIHTNTSSVDSLQTFSDRLLHVTINSASWEGNGRANVDDKIWIRTTQTTLNKCSYVWRSVLEIDLPMTSEQVLNIGANLLTIICHPIYLIISSLHVWLLVMIHHRWTWNMGSVEQSQMNPMPPHLTNNMGHGIVWRISNAYSGAPSFISYLMAQSTYLVHEYIIIHTYRMGMKICHAHFF